MTSRQLTRREALRLTGACAAVAAISPAALTQDTTGPLSAIAFRRISYDVHDLARSRDFYSSLLGLRTAFEDEDRCVLEFGHPTNALYLRKLKNADGKSHLINFAFSIASYDSARVESELQRRNLSPRADGKYAWAIRDPNGITLHLCSEHEEFDDHTAPAASSTTPLQAVAVSHAVLRTDNLPQSRHFYTSLLGMTVVHEDPQQCILAIGDQGNHLWLKTLGPDATKPYIEAFAFTVSAFDRKRTKQQLEQHGLTPQPNTEEGWTVVDPDGNPFGIGSHRLIDALPKA